MLSAVVPAAGATATPAAVVGRYILYNNSAYDGKDAAANAADDGAIATDKQALFPAQTAKFANYTSYSKGINGIMIDIADLPSPGTLTAGDFEFTIGNENDPHAYAPAPAPTTVLVRPGAGVSGSTRVEIVWPDKAIQKEWLRVKVKADPATGLNSPDIFYFGNAVGEAGNHANDAQVTAQDELLARANPHNLLDNPAPIDYPYDYNRDKQVNAADQLIARTNHTTFETALQLITPYAVLDFDDIPVPDPTVGVFVPANYHGFNTTDSGGLFESFFVESDADYRSLPNSTGTAGYGNSYGAPSGPQAASNDSGIALTKFSRTTPFDFFGVNVSTFAVLNKFDPTSARTLTVAGFRGGVAVPGDTITVTLDPTAYHFLSTNWTGIDSVQFLASGAPDTARAPGGYFLFDDFEYAEPKPATTPTTASVNSALASNSGSTFGLSPKDKDRVADKPRLALLA